MFYERLVQVTATIILRYITVKKVLKKVQSYFWSFFLGFKCYLQIRFIKNVLINVLENLYLDRLTLVD